MGVMLWRACLASSRDCNTIIVALELVLSVVEPSTGEEFRGLLLWTVYDNLGVYVNNLEVKYRKWGRLGGRNTINDTKKLPQVLPKVPMLDRILMQIVIVICTLSAIEGGENDSIQPTQLQTMFVVHEPAKVVYTREPAVVYRLGE